MRSLTARIVLLAAVVALATAALTGFALVRALGATNRDQAEQNLLATADRIAAMAETGRDVRVALAEKLAERAGWRVEIVPSGGTPRTLPFTATDVATAAPDAPVVERDQGDGGWLVVTRPAGGTVVLVARRVTDAVQLTPTQRRRVILGGILGLAGGAAAGLVIALSITRPLSRVATTARRLSAGERGLPVPHTGPTEVKVVAEALDALSRALAASEARQREFLLAVSHELRTPLTAVAGYAEALADSALPQAEIPQAASVIVSESARLRRRVEDLMSLARMEADDFRLALVPTDVGALIAAAAEAIAPRAMAAGVRLSVEAPTAGPVIVTDGERLRQAVDALADNALKVLAGQEAAGVPLVLACTRAPDGGVRVEVRDGGPGLPPEDLAVAFERGRLTERYRGRRPVGSGVGLALVGELARRMGGWAEASMAAEGGVCFAVVLPVPPETSSFPPSPASPPSPAPS